MMRVGWDAIWLTYMYKDFVYSVTDAERRLHL